VIRQQTFAAPVRTGVRWLCRLVLRTLGVHSRMQGALPPGGALLLANHLGWVDILAMLAHVDCTFVAKREVAGWPVVGWLARRLGVVFVDRARKRDLLCAIPAMTDALARGQRILLFPEGTTGDGRTLLPFKSALVDAAVRARVPVVPIAISASAADMDARALCWIGTETLAQNLPRLRALTSAAVSLRVGTAVPPGACRKMLTHRARLAIFALVNWPAVRGDARCVRVPAGIHTPEGVATGSLMMPR